MKFMGYPRKNGMVGTRNLLAIIPTVFCANHVVTKITHAVANACAFTHPVGCGYPGPDQQITMHMLERIAAHPNFGAVLFVGLGCERAQFEALDLVDVKVCKPVHYLNIQNEGDSVKAIEKGICVAKDLAMELEKEQRVPCGLDGLVLGLKCGGTDATSGLVANPALGVASDRLIANGGSAILTEITELCGTEHIMSKQAKNEQVAVKIQECVKRNVDQLLRATKVAHKGMGERLLVSPGNADGGVSNVVEKALGGLKKAGSSTIEDVIKYGDPITGHGLFLMDGPGHDGESVSGLVASGANVVVFTTGRGTPAGFAGVPVIKATGNPNLAEKMKANIDFNAGRMLTEGVTLEEVGNELFNEILETASGKYVKAEQLGHEELFCISRYVAEQQICEGQIYTSSTCC